MKIKFSTILAMDSFPNQIRFAKGLNANDTYALGANVVRILGSLGMESIRIFLNPSQDRNELASQSPTPSMQSERRVKST